MPRRNLGIAVDASFFVSSGIQVLMEESNINCSMLMQVLK